MPRHLLQCYSRTVSKLLVLSLPGADKFPNTGNLPTRASNPPSPLKALNRPEAPYTPMKLHSPPKQGAVFRFFRRCRGYRLSKDMHLEPHTIQAEKVLNVLLKPSRTCVESFEALEPPNPIASTHPKP